MDDIDISLLRLLQQDSRSTVSELSKRLNLSRPSVAERIARLCEQGVIEEFTARVSPRSLGRRVLLFIELSSLKVSPQVFEERFSGDSALLECHRVTGRGDYILKASVNDIEGMTQLINRLIPYGNLSTSVVLESPVSHRHILPLPREEHNTGGKP